MNMPPTHAARSRRIGRALGAPGTAGRIPSLDGLRAVAVFLVFLVHYDALFAAFTTPTGWSRSLSTFWGSAGNSGVDLFFLLSGFLIYGILLARPRGIRRFLLRRAHRLYPVFVFVFLIYVVSMLVLPSALTSPDKPPITVLYLLENLALLPGLFPIAPLIPVAWSLSYEAAFYLVAPALIALLRLRVLSRRRRVLTLSALFALQAVLTALGFFPHARTLMFIVGALLWETAGSGVVDARLNSRGELLTSLFFAVALVPAGLILLDYPHVGALARTLLSLLRVAILGAASFPLALYGIRFDGRLRAFLDAGPVRALGNISYSYYLIHGASMHIARSALARLVSGSPLSPALCWSVRLAAVFRFTAAGAAGVSILGEQPRSVPSAIRRSPAATYRTARLDSPLAPVLCPAPAVDFAIGADANAQGRRIQE